VGRQRRGVRAGIMLNRSANRCNGCGRALTVAVTMAES
jgi:hypothetical protein